MEESKVDLPMSIAEFYKGKSILLTGFTGVIGKLLVEKLLYSCSELDTIYVLIRPKKGQTPQQRVQQVFTSKAFTRVREKHPGMLESKVVGVAGDMMEERLGLSQEDEQLLRREVSIILHGAASVRFDDPLDIAVRINTLGAKRMVDLALTMPRLVCLTYISTAYSNCDHLYIKEEMYPPKADWRKTMDVCEEIDLAILNILQAKYIDKMPNTYSFSKSLAEQVINDHRSQLPAVIVRMSAVSYSTKEPMIGWCDNKYGVIGTGLAFALGLARCFLIRSDVKLNLIPSDIAVNSVLAATWKTALTHKEGAMDVYNACCPESKLELLRTCGKLFREKQMFETLKKDGVYHESVVFCDSVLSYKINNLFRQFLPSLFIDLLLVLSGIKPMVVSVRRKIFLTSLSLYRFATNTFKFETHKFDALVDDMNAQDRDEFGWSEEMFKMYINGLGVYNNLNQTVLKPLYDDLKTNSKRLRMLYIVDKFAAYLTYSLVGFFLYYFNIPSILLSTAVRLVNFP